ncbi:uncharacterized protein Dana_GF17733 [Drosophila ananassae]|uniref:Uncharacterized protein n=1 Tax=Drosophila ananassae TaxID=7217 RepID=A0A0P8YKR0_DROAN|nr:uncharacterized protein Dana_GF17733 [Drosophila ananassae]
MITFYIWVVAGILLWLHFLWSRRRFYKLMLEIPGPKGVPFLGTVPEYVINKLQIIQRTKHMDIYGSTILIWMGINPVLLTRDPKIAEDILISSQCLNRASNITKPISDTFESGLLTLREPEWQQRRRNLNSSFKPNLLLNFVPIFNSEATILVNIMDNFVGQKDVLPHLLRWSFRTGCQTILGTEVKEDLDNTLIESWQSVLRSIMLCIALPFPRNKIFSSIFGFERRRAKHLDRLNAFMDDILQQKLRKISQNELDSPIVINRLVDLFRSGQIGYNHIKGECNSTIIASLETTALTVTHTLILLAMFPEYQDITFEELKMVLPTSEESM